MFTMASCNLFMDEKEGSKMACIGFWLSAEAVISTPGAVKALESVYPGKICSLSARGRLYT